SVFELLQSRMNLAEQLVILPSLILDASKHISSPIFNTISSFVDSYYTERQEASEQLCQAFDEIVC
ncbi:hypothetical protein PRIPAC_83863, partial [Pristionchus pacificus]